MGPITDEVAAALAGKSVKFVKFDFTSDETRRKAEAEADALGVAGTYAKHANNTGFALLYNTKTQKVLTTLSARQDAAEWSKHIEGGLGGS